MVVQDKPTAPKQEMSVILHVSAGMLQQLQRRNFNNEERMRMNLSAALLYGHEVIEHQHLCYCSRGEIMAFVHTAEQYHAPHLPMSDITVTLPRKTYFRLRFAARDLDVSVEEYANYCLATEMYVSALFQKPSLPKD